MRKYITALVIFSLMFLGFSSLSHSAGFLIYEHGAAAMAMGGAFVAVANNPTAIFHNPAGIAFLEGTQVSFGTTLITSNSSLNLTNLGTIAETKKQWFYPSTAYITHKITDRIVAGFGFFTPYGLGTKWDEDYPQNTNFPLRFISTKDDMKTFFFNPVIAVKLDESFSVAVGVTYIYSTLEVDRVNVIDLTALPGGSTYEAPVNLKGNGDAFALNAGALYRGDNFSLGVNWRGGFNLDFTGDLLLDNVNIPAPFQPFVPTAADVATTLSIPHILGFGAAFNLTPSLMISADFHYILWSAFDQFVIEIDNPAPAPDATETFLENWKDSWLVRGGLQYMVNENFALRFGALYDKTPQPVESMDPFLPDANRFALTGGFGYQSGNFVINVAYQFEPFSDRESANRSVLLHPVTGANLGLGTYSTTAHLIGVSIGFII
jgi:long-chain fatty acid transport protein